MNIEDHLFKLHDELKNKTYRHSAYTTFYVNDPKLRQINKASVRDRVLNHAIFRALYPLFDQHFIYDSYSCRIGKGSHRAVNRLQSFLNKISDNNSRVTYALKCDVRKFFDSIDQIVLLRLIQTHVQDENALWLIGQIISSFGKLPGTGLPLGNVTSQLFANIYLNELDQFIKHKVKATYCLRYCDDFIILGNDRGNLWTDAEAINMFLKSILKLELHPNKIIIRKYRQGVDFLGYVVLPYHSMLRAKTKRRIFNNISVKSLSSYLGVASHCNGHGLKQKLLNIVKNRVE